MSVWHVKLLVCVCGVWVGVKLPVQERREERARCHIVQCGTVRCAAVRLVFFSFNVLGYGPCFVETGIAVKKSHSGRR